jgi:hypothetical protein
MVIWSLYLQLPEQSMPITTNVVISNPAHGEVYGDTTLCVKVCQRLATGCGFLGVFRLPPPIKLTAMI